jgi:hypothetical protein
MSGNDICSVDIEFAGCFGGVPLWKMFIGNFVENVPGDQIWYGEKVGGQTPEGVYNLVAGSDASPATLTIVLVDAAAIIAPGSFSCAS